MFAWLFSAFEKIPSCGFRLHLASHVTVLLPATFWCTVAQAQMCCSSVASVFLQLLEQLPQKIMPVASGAIKPQMYLNQNTLVEMTLG